MTVLERLKAAGYDPAVSLFPDSTVVLVHGDDDAPHKELGGAVALVLALLLDVVGQCFHHPALLTPYSNAWPGST